MQNLLTRFLTVPRDFTHQAIVFLIIIFAAKFGQYLFFGWATAPAILWPPTGIALAVLYLLGYRYVAVIYAGLLFATVTGPIGFVWPWTFFTTAGQVLGAVVGVYLLRRSGYHTDQTNVKKVGKFLLAIVVASTIAPTVTTLVGPLLGTLSVPVYVTWSHAWAGYVFSCLILFPLITTWVPFTITKVYSFSKTAEWCVVVLQIAIAIHGIFWTHGQGEWLFFYFGILFVSLFWACLRFSARMVNILIFLGTAFGFTGLFLSTDTEALLSVRLFRAEFFTLLVIPIFYTFSAVVQDSMNTIAALAMTKAKIEDENKTKNEFIAVLAHELRNPLAPLKTTLEILEMEPLSIESKSHVQNAHRQVHTMQRLLDDLLDVTRMSQGKFELKISVANLCAMLQHCIESTKDICQKRQHRVIMDNICDDRIWLDVDPIRFEQVVVNIINNAAKYTNMGGEIRIRNYIKGNWAVLEIADNGIGISAENIESIFYSFWQVKKIVPHSSGGIGVGLSLTKQIVTMHGGTIRAESAGIDKGSTFIISLPLAAHVPKADTLIPAHRAPLQPLRILVADDNVAAAKALAQLLSLKNHVVECAYSGSETLTAVTRFKPDCVILDIGLPDFDGYVVAQRLRLAGYQNKIIALTGYGQKADIEQALNNGFDLFLIKPVGLKQLEDYFYEIAT